MTKSSLVGSGCACPLSCLIALCQAEMSWLWLIFDSWQLIFDSWPLPFKCLAQSYTENRMKAISQETPVGQGLMPLILGDNRGFVFWDHIGDIVAFLKKVPYLQKIRKVREYKLACIILNQNMRGLSKQNMKFVRFLMRLWIQVTKKRWYLTKSHIGTLIIIYSPLIWTLPEYLTILYLSIIIHTYLLIAGWT